MAESWSCQIGEDVKSALRDFRRHQRSNFSALVLEIDTHKKVVKVQVQLNNTSIDAIRDVLPHTQPRCVYGVAPVYCCNSCDCLYFVYS